MAEEKLEEQLIALFGKIEARKKKEKAEKQTSEVTDAPIQEVIILQPPCNLTNTTTTTTESAGREAETETQTSTIEKEPETQIIVKSQTSDIVMYYDITTNNINQTSLTRSQQEVQNIQKIRCRTKKIVTRKE